MPNPRPADLTDDQYQTLVGLGLTDGAIKYLRPEAMAERLAAPQPTLTLPSAGRTVPDPAVTTRGPEPSLRAQQDFVQSFLADPAKQQEAAEAMERVRSTQFATGEDEPRPGMSLLQSLAQPISSSDFPAVQVARGTLPPEEASKLARVIGAALPQTTQTPQVRQQTDRYLTQARQAAVQQAEANLAAGRYQFDREDPRFAQEIKNRQRAIMVGEIPPTLQGAVLRPGEEVTAEGELAAQMAKGMESRLPTGSMIESPGLYMGRLLSVPTSLPTALREDTTVEQTIKEGMGFIGLGADLGNDAAEALDLDEDSYLRSALIGAGGAVGLVGELLTPLDLGATAVTRGVGQAAKTARLAKAADLTYTPADLLYKPRRFSLNERIINAHADSTPVREGAESYIRLVADDAFSSRTTVKPDKFDELVQTYYGKPADEALTEARQAGLLPDSVKTADEWRIMANNDAAKPVIKAPFEDLPGADAALRRTSALRTKAGQRVLRRATTTLGRAGKGLASVRLTDELVAPASTAAEITKEFQQTLIGKMATEIRRKPQAYIDDNGMLDAQAVYEAVRAQFGKPTFASVEIPQASRMRELFTLVDDAAGTTLPKEYARAVFGMGAGVAPARLNAGMFTEGHLPKAGAKLRLQDWNEGVALLYRDSAASHPGVRALGGEGVAKQFIDPVSTTGIPLTEAKKTARQVETVLLPQELRPNAIRKATTYNAPRGWKNTFDPDNLAGVAPYLRPIIRKVGESFNSMDLDFMAKWRAAKKSGLSHQDAYAEVVVGAYDTPKSFVYDALMNAYGGFESVADVMALSNGLQIKNLLGGVEPSVVRRAVGRVLHAVEAGKVTPPDDLIDTVEALAAALRATNPQEAMGLTARALELLDSSTLKKLADSVDDPSFKAMLDEAFLEYPDPKLIMRRPQAAELFSMSYSQRRIENILTETLTEAKVFQAGDPNVWGSVKFGLQGDDWAANMARNFRSAIEMQVPDLTDAAVNGILIRAMAQQNMTRFTLNKVPTARELLDILPPGTNGAFNTPSSIAQFLPGASPELLKMVWGSAIGAVDTANPAKFGSVFGTEMLPAYYRDLTESVLTVAQSRLPAGRALDLLPVPEKTREFLLGRLNLPAFTETLQEVMKKAGRNHKQNRLAKFLTLIFDNGFVARTMKGGLLSGVLLPTFRYMGMNVWTAPGMIHQTIGTQAALRSMVLNPDALKTADTVYRGTNTGEVLFTTPQGQVYTRGAVADLMRRVQSQVGAELRGDMFASWKAYSETRAAGDFMAPRKWFVSARRSGFKATGLSIEGGLASSPNLWAEVADGTDYYFRAGVMIDALKAGRPPDEALALARDALLDYSKVSQFEKDTVSKAIWFWSFRRENLRTSAIAMMDNPQRFRAQYSLANNGFDYDDRYTEHTREYAENRPFAELVNDPVTRKRYATAGPALALLDGVAELLDYMSAGLFLIDTAAYVATGASVYGRGGAEVGATFGQRVGEGGRRLSEALFGVGLEELSPPAALVVGFLTGTVVQFGDVRGVGTYLDPRMLAYVNSVDDMQSIFFGLIDIEPIPPAEERTGGGRFNGRQWRVAPESKHAHRVLMAALLTVGLQRATRDYAPLLMEARGMEDVAGHQTAMDELLFQSGLSTPVSLPTGQERQIENERAIIRMLREQTRD